MSIDLRLQFARWEPAAWLAHLDLMRLFERSIRRAGLPVQYSQGFNPRLRLAFALPLGVGLETRDDYVDLTMREEISPEAAVNSLNSALPHGVRILAAWPAPAGKSLMSQICAATYQIEAARIGLAADLLIQTHADKNWRTHKFSKGREVEVDIRPLVRQIISDGPDRLILLADAGSRSNLRPDLLLQVLVDQGFSPRQAADARLIRTALWAEHPTHGALVSPRDIT